MLANEAMNDTITYSNLDVDGQWGDWTFNAAASSEGTGQTGEPIELPAQLTAKWYPGTVFRYNRILCKEPIRDPEEFQPP